MVEIVSDNIVKYIKNFPWYVSQCIWKSDRCQISLGCYAIDSFPILPRSKLRPRVIDTVGLRL